MAAARRAPGALDRTAIYSLSTSIAFLGGIDARAAISCEDADDLVGGRLRLGVLGVDSRISGGWGGAMSTLIERVSSRMKPDGSPRIFARGTKSRMACDQR